MRRTLVVITGPTGVGKTAICIDVALSLGVPIINADSRQIYRGMEIGTAAPTPAELAAVKHHFVGILNPNEYYNAAMFESAVMALLEQWWGDEAAGRSVALMSGGSMMYIDAVCRGLDDIPTISSDTRAAVQTLYEQGGIEALLSELARHDPDYLGIVDKQNWRRVAHALEVCRQTGRTYTSYRQRAAVKRPFDIIKIGLSRERSNLYSRINTRVETMVSEGLVEEVKALERYRHCNALNTVGYKEIFEFLDGATTLDNAVEAIKTNTRHYARRQLTWFRRDETIKWMDAEDRQAVLDYISEAVRR